MNNKHSHEKRSDEKGNLRNTAEQMATWAIAHPMHEETDAKKLLHELQVHQIELEMQNVELHNAQLETEKVIKKLTTINENLQKSILEHNARHLKEKTYNEALLADLNIKISNEILQPLNELSEIAKQIKQSGTDQQLLQNITKLKMAAQRLLGGVRSF